MMMASNARKLGAGLAWRLPVALGVACWVLGGCRTFTADKWVDPKHDLRGSPILVLPFRQGKLWYYESPRGAELARVLALKIQESCSSLLVDDALVEQQVLENFEDPPPLARWGKATGARHVVYGDILSVGVHQRSVIGMLQGQIRVAFQVWDVDKDRLAFQDEVRLTFPRDPSKESAGVFEYTEEEIVKRLTVRAVDRIAGALCGRRVDPTDPDR